jgi:antitoxin CptB
MDLLLGRFADACLSGFGEDELRLYSELLSESDPDLYDWLMGKGEAPEAFRGIMERFRSFTMSGAR